MLAVLGVALLAAAVVLFQWAYIEHRRPDPKAWTRPEYAAHFISLVLTAALASGVAFGIAAVVRQGAHPITAMHGVIVLLIVVATAGVVVMQQRGWVRLRAAAVPAGVHGLRVAANDSGPRVPPRRTPSKPKPRRAA